MRMGKLVFGATLALAVAISSCALKVDPKSIKIEGLDKMIVTCSATLAPEAGSTALSGQPAPINLKAAGGVAPYQIVDTAVNFSSETVLSRTYTNTSTSNKVQVDTVSIKDSLGLVGQCNFLVTVAPAGSTPSTLACSLASTPSAPTINQDVNFTATASGGTAPYTFSQFNGGTDSSTLVALASTSSTTAAAKAKYTTPGLRSASVQLTDSAGTTVSCSQSVQVGAGPSVNTIASPATAVAAGNPIVLTATASGFTSSPTYTFATTRSGVTISTAGNQATVNSSTTQTAFDVVVTATNGTQTATQTVSLAFTTAASLSCTVKHPSGMLYVGDAVKFEVEASTGEALQITYFATQSDATAVAETLSSRTIRYAVAGIKNALVQAKSVATGALCQAGAVMSDTLEITPASAQPLTCSAYTSSNPANAGQYFRVWAAIAGGQGAKRVDSLTITRSTSGSASYDGYWVDSTSAQLRVYNTGSYQITLLLKDTAGNTGSCTTSQVIW